MMLLLMPTSTYNSQSILNSHCISGIISSHCSSTIYVTSLKGNLVLPLSRNDAEKDGLDPGDFVPTEHAKLCMVVHSYNLSTAGGRQEDPVFKSLFNRVSSSKLGYMKHPPPTDNTKQTKNGGFDQNVQKKSYMFFKMLTILYCLRNTSIKLDHYPHILLYNSNI